MAQISGIIAQAEHIITDMNPVFLVVGKRIWRRPDQRHVGLSDVKKLRQFINAGSLEEFTYTGHPKIVAARLRDDGSIF